MTAREEGPKRGGNARNGELRHAAAKPAPDREADREAGKG